MIEVQTRDNHRVVINVTDRHQHPDTGQEIDPRVQEALDRLQKIAVSAPVPDSALEDIELILDSNVCISPTFFLRKKKPINKHVAHHFVANDDFATELYDELEKVGAFRFVDDIVLSATAMANLHRIIGVFAFCALGQLKVADMGKDYAHAIVSWFRQPDDSRWRTDFETNPGLAQCLRAVVLGLAKLLDDPTLEERSGVKTPSMWRSVLSKDFMSSDDPLVIPIARHLASFLASTTAQPRLCSQAARLLAEWMAETHPGATLLEICALRDRKSSFSNFIEQRRKKLDRQHIDLVFAAKRLTDYMIEQMSSENPGASFYSIVPDSELLRAKGEISLPPRPASARARPLPEKLYGLAKSILDQGEAGWAGTCATFKEQINGTKVYCPVIPTLLRCALEIPLRIVQWRRLDSGEGDVRTFNADAATWVTNQGPFAGYWANRAGKRHQGFPEQGYAHEFTDGVASITGFWINTNKTGTPYSIPWQHAGVHKRLYELKLWQEKYNPIPGPIGPNQYIDAADEISLAAKEKMPDIFPLFRLLPTKSRKWKGRIPTGSEVDRSWQYFMAEVERVWNLENPDNAIKIVERHPQTGMPHRARYNLHGMRVRGLTDLFRAGVPLELLSKVVAGHSTVRMTLYYAKFDPIEVDKQLTDAALNARALAAQSLMDEFARVSLDEALQRAVSMSPAAIEEAHTLRSSLTYTNVDLGFCPWECRRCGDGGPVKRHTEMKGGKKNTLYDPVPGGDQNCIMCRHLITGPPWMLQLELFGSKLLEQRRFLATKEIECHDENDQFYRQVNAGDLTATRHKQIWDVKWLAKHTKIKNEQAIVETSVFNVSVLLQACVVLNELEKGSGQVPMIATDRASAIHFVETTEFENSLVQTKASRLIPVLEDARIEAIRDRYLSTVLFNAGGTPPILIPELTERQRRDSMDAYAEIMLQKVSAAQRKALIDDEIKLVDTQTWREVRDVMHAALNNSIELLPGEGKTSPEIDAAVLEVLK
jgi:hypothetical protein